MPGLFPPGLVKRLARAARAGAGAAVASFRESAPPAAAPVAGSVAEDPTPADVAVTVAASPASIGATGATGATVDDRNARYDRATVAVIERVLGASAGVALDIGGNEGIITAEIVRVAPDRRHHAFEPIPALAAALRARFPGVEVHEVALADKDGDATFHHVVTNTGYSGLRERRYDRENEQIELIQVRMGRLDDEVPADVPVAFVKIDVEGGEVGVLRGGMELLRRWRPVVVFEHGLGASDYYGTGPEDVYGLFEELGFEVHLLDGWLAGGDPMDRAEFVRQFVTNENYYFLAAPART